MEQSPARHHRLLLSYLERVARGEVKRLLVCMPPGSAKSTYCSVLFPAWFFAQRPHLNIIGASHGSGLAEDFSKAVQNYVRQHPTILGYGLATSNVERWRTTNGGFYRAAGVGGSITGRRADGAIIDDSIKGAEDAESLTTRDKVWNWYQAELYTRLKPGAWIIHVTCMTGETPVLMADGSERRLDEIKVGDHVGTYANGDLRASAVLAWKPQREDDIYEIRMSSGRTVRANERHPFLVQRGESTEWVRLRNLCPGERIVALTAGNAISPQGVRASAWSTTTERAGPPEFGHHRIPEKITELGECATATVSSPRNTTPSSPLRTDAARSAAALRAPKPIEQPGPTASPWTMTMRPARFGDFSVTTAILCSAMQEKIPTGYGRLSPTSTDFGRDEIVSITPAGRAIVYDIEIETTENFIANGLVSHNTRWNEDDLAGRQIAAASNGGDDWTVLTLPAISASMDDALGRKIGEALWPEWQDEIALLGGIRPGGEIVAGIRRNVGEYVWGALYQQDPKPRGASFFNTDLLLVPHATETRLDAEGNRVPVLVPVETPSKSDTVFGVVDTAIKTGQKNDSTAVTFYAYDTLAKIPATIVDWDIVQIEGAKQEEWLPTVLARCEELAKECGARHGSAGLFIEDKATGTVLIQQAQNRARETGVPTLARAIDSKLTSMGKDERAIAAEPYLREDRVKISRYAFEKTKVHKGRSANHLLLQIGDFRLGASDGASDDLLDTFCYGVAITSGTNAGKRRGI